MGTRCLIGFGTPERFSATYNHSDGYPAGVGKALWDCYHDDYYGNLKQMLMMLSEHMAGWASFTHRICYCHTLERGDQPMFITHKDEPGLCHWAYLLDADTQRLRILKRVEMRWQQWAMVDLRGPEPEWNALERGKPESEGNDDNETTGL